MRGLRGLRELDTLMGGGKAPDVVADLARELEKGDYSIVTFLLAVKGAIVLVLDILISYSLWRAHLS